LFRGVALGSDMSRGLSSLEWASAQDTAYIPWRAMIRCAIDGI
jgi:hypothetical protein